MSYEVAAEKPSRVIPIVTGIVVVGLLGWLIYMLVKKSQKTTQTQVAAVNQLTPQQQLQVRAAIASAANGKGSAVVSQPTMNGARPSYTSVISGQEYAQQNMAGHQQYFPNDPRYQAQPQCGMQASPQCGMVATAQCGLAARQPCVAGPEPATYYPYGGGQAAASFDSAYPNEEDMSSLYPRGCPTSQQSGYALNVNSLMPASWRSGNSCGDAAAVDGSQWTKYAPTKEAFDRYITAQGSARLSATTRSSLSRQIGIPNLLRQSPPMPLAAENVVFNDSSLRLDQVFKAMGRYPESTAC